MSLLDRQLRQRQTDARKHIDDDLLGHRVVDRAAKDRVPAQQAREEGVVVPLLAGRGRVAQEYHAGLVDEGEEAEVARVLARCFVDEEAFAAQGAGAEEEDHAGLLCVSNLIIILFGEREGGV